MSPHASPVVAATATRHRSDSEPVAKFFRLVRYVRASPLYVVSTGRRAVMFIGHFTEQPWQDDKTGLMGTQSLDLSISTGVYDPVGGARLYNRYIDEKIYAEEVGFDGLMLNEHHSTPFCMQGVTNVGASILAQ